jgi:hypothetical protein
MQQILGHRLKHVNLPPFVGRVRIARAEERRPLVRFSIVPFLGTPLGEE